MTTAARVLDVLARVVESDDVRDKPELPLYGELLDSMRTVELLVALEEAFGIQISAAELDREEWATPSRVVSFVERRLTA